MSAVILLLAKLTDSIKLVLWKQKRTKGSPKDRLYNIVDDRSRQRLSECSNVLEETEDGRRCHNGTRLHMSPGRIVS